MPDRRRPYSHQRNRRPRPHLPPETSFPLQPLDVVRDPENAAAVFVTWNQNVIAQPPGGFGYKITMPDLPDAISQEVIQISPIITHEAFDAEIFDPATFEDNLGTREVLPVSGIYVAPFTPCPVTNKDPYALLMISALKIEDDPTKIRVTFNQRVSANPATAENMGLQNGIAFTGGAIDVEQVDALTLDYSWGSDVPGPVAGWTLTTDAGPPGAIAYYGLYTPFQTIGVEEP